MAASCRNMNRKWGKWDGAIPFYKDSLCSFPDSCLNAWEWAESHNTVASVPISTDQCLSDSRPAEARQYA